MSPADSHSIQALTARLQQIAQESDGIRERLRALASSDGHTIVAKSGNSDVKKTRLTRLEEISVEAERIRARLHELGDVADS